MDFDFGNGFDFSSILGTGLDALVKYQTARRVMAAPTMIAPGDMQQVALPSLPALGAGAARMLGLGGTAVAAVGGAVVRAGSRLITTALGAMSRKRVVSIAKTLGIQGAATALGIGAVELAQLVIDDSAKHKRGKGVSASALKTTRRTMRTVEKMHRQIAGYCRDAGVRTTRFVRAPQPSKRCR